MDFLGIPCDSLVPGGLDPPWRDSAPWSQEAPQKKPREAEEEDALPDSRPTLDAEARVLRELRARAGDGGRGGWAGDEGSFFWGGFVVFCKGFWLGLHGTIVFQETRGLFVHLVV